MNGRDPMTFTHGGGWLAGVSFVAFLLPGVAVVVAAVMFAITDPTIPVGGVCAMGGLGLGMVLLGVALSFGRLEKVIDRRRLLVTDRWQVLWLSRTKDHPLLSFTAVGLSEGSVSSENASYPRYRIRLVGD